MLLVAWIKQMFDVTVKTLPPSSFLTLPWTQQENRAELLASNYQSLWTEEPSSSQIGSNAHYLLHAAHLLELFRLLRVQRIGWTRRPAFPRATGRGNGQLKLRAAGDWMDAVTKTYWAVQTELVVLPNPFSLLLYVIWMASLSTYRNLRIGCNVGSSASAPRWMCTGTTFLRHATLQTETWEGNMWLLLTSTILPTRR